MGSNRERLDVIWDTGSSVYLAETHDCTSCIAPVYDYTDEAAPGGSFSQTSGTYTQRYLDGTRIEGNWVTDTVCVLDDPSTCVANFNWVAAYEANLDSDEDGIIGMS